MIWSIHTFDIDPNNEYQVRVFRLLCNLELANISAKWSSGEYINRPVLSQNEYVFSLSIYNASIYEALKSFKESRGMLLRVLTEANITERRLDYQRFKNEWDFLNSREVNQLINQIRPIRNQSTFHIDPQPVKAFMESIASQNGLVSVVEVENNSVDQHGFSPLATEIIFKHLNTNLTNQEDNAPELIGKAYHAMRFIVNTALLVLFNVTIEENQPLERNLS